MRVSGMRGGGENSKLAPISRFYFVLTALYLIEEGIEGGVEIWGGGDERSTGWLFIGGNILISESVVWWILKDEEVIIKSRPSSTLFINLAPIPGAIKVWLEIGPFSLWDIILDLERMPDEGELTLYLRLDVSVVQGFCCSCRLKIENLSHKRLTIQALWNLHQFWWIL